MKYNKMFTMKTSPEFLGTLGELAASANRERCDFLRELINLLAINQRLRQTIINAMGGAYGKSD